MQLEAADWSIQATPPVHLQGFTPTFVTFSTGVDTSIANCAIRGRFGFSSVCLEWRRAASWQRPSGRALRQSHQFKSQLPKELRPAFVD